MKTIDLQTIIDELDLYMDEESKYLDTETGEIVAVRFEEMRIAEDAEEGEDFSEYPDWQREDIEIAMDILNHFDDDKYIELPNKRDIDEYSIMEDFCESLENVRIQKVLSSAIQEKGAFRRFKDEIYRIGIEEDWFSFKNKSLKKLAIEWCEEYGITYRKSVL